MIKQKLTSRKFILTIILFILILILVLGGSHITMTQSDLLMKAIYVLGIYVFGESIVDAARVLRTYDKNGNGKIDGTEIVDLIADTVEAALKGEKQDGTNDDRNS